MRSIYLALAILACAGCTWVRLTEEGARVRQATAADVAGCTRIGTAAAVTRDRVLLERNPREVQEELLVLAANEAATLGGDAIVPLAPPEAGRQEFAVYRCTGS